MMNSMPLMITPIPNSLIFAVFSLFITTTTADPRISKADLHCGTIKVSTNQFVPSFIKEMDAVATLINKQGWGTYSYGSNPTIFSLAQCMDDLSHTDCLLCFTESRTKLPSCVPSISARMHLDGCFLRWDNYSFYEESVDPVVDKSVCDPSTTTDLDNSKLKLFTQKVDQVIKNVAESAVVSNNGFAVVEMKGEITSLYALAQCWKTINKTGCQMCLEKAGREASKCSPKKEGRGLNAGCYLRYSTHKFYNEGRDDNNRHGGN